MKKTTVLAGLFLFSFAGVTQAALLTNGDFQTGDLTGWNYASNVTVSTGGGGNSIAKFNVASPISGNGSAQLYQNFDVNPGWDGINIQFDVQFNTGVVTSQDFFRALTRLEIDGNPTDNVNQFFKITENTGGWQHVSSTILFAGLTIDPATPNARLSFLLDENVKDWSWANLDNVEVNAVPVPAALFMFAPALLGFMGLRRRAKNKVS